MIAEERNRAALYGAAQAGVPTWKLRHTTGHASAAVLSEYVRDSEIFVGNAAGTLL